MGSTLSTHEDGAEHPESALSCGAFSSLATLAVRTGIKDTAVHRQRDAEAGPSHLPAQPSKMPHARSKHMQYTPRRAQHPPKNAFQRWWESMVESWRRTTSPHTPHRTSRQRRPLNIGNPTDFRRVDSAFANGEVMAISDNMKRLPSRKAIPPHNTPPPPSRLSSKPHFTVPRKPMRAASAHNSSARFRTLAPAKSAPDLRDATPASVEAFPATRASDKRASPTEYRDNPMSPVSTRSMRKRRSSSLRQQVAIEDDVRELQMIIEEKRGLHSRESSQQTHQRHVSAIAPKMTMQAPPELLSDIGSAFSRPLTIAAPGRFQSDGGRSMPGASTAPRLGLARSNTDPLLFSTHGQRQPESYDAAPATPENERCPSLASSPTSFIAATSPLFPHRVLRSHSGSSTPQTTPSISDSPSTVRSVADLQHGPAGGSGFWWEYATPKDFRNDVDVNVNMDWEELEIRPPVPLKVRRR